MKRSAAAPSRPGPDQSVAGEEDPGSALEQFSELMKNPQPGAAAPAHPDTGREGDAAPAAPAPAPAPAPADPDRPG